MAWLRFGTTRGINLDECSEWTYEDKVAKPLTPSAETAARSRAAASSPAEGATPSEPPATIPTLHFLMREKREVVLQGEEATKALAYLVGVTGSV